MPVPSSWDMLSGAGSGPVVLGADFPARRRAEAGFADLAGRIGRQYRFLQTKPPSAELAFRPGRPRPGQPGSSATYVSPWIEGIRQARPPVLAVLGYRIGGVYAAAIAEGIAQWQPMPKIILFDPQFTSAGLLCSEFHREISANSSLLGDDEIEQARKAITEIAANPPGDVLDVAAEMVESYLEAVTPAFERAGLGSARGEASTRVFESYISWLSAADLIDPGSAWKHSTGIASAGYAGLPGRTPAVRDGQGPVGRMIPFDVGHADLLRSESVARAVLDLLGSR